jgi:hypothetical protein
MEMVADKPVGIDGDCMSYSTRRYSKGPSFGDGGYEQAMLFVDISQLIINSSSGR